MFDLDDLAGWMTKYNEIHVAVPYYDLPGGSVAGFHTITRPVFYVFDQRHRHRHEDD